MASTTLTSELEAINTMLQAAGEAPVQTLSLTGLLPLEQAKTVLDETSRAVQSYGWKFNTEYDWPLTPDGVTGQIALPSNTLTCDVNAEYASKYDPIARGLKLYDAKNRTLVWPEALKATMIFLLGWDDLPQAARHYIMVKAARTFQGRDAGSDAVDRFTENDEVTARLAMSQYETDVGNPNMIYDSMSAFAVIAGREDVWPS